MPWKFKNPLIEQFQKIKKESDKQQEQFKKIHDTFMRNLGYVWTDDPPEPETDRAPAIQKSDPPRKKETRKELVDRLWRKRGRKMVELYTQANVDKSLYYKWEKGDKKLPDGCAEDMRIRNVLDSQ